MISDLIGVTRLWMKSQRKKIPESSGKFGKTPEEDPEFFPF